MKWTGREHAMQGKLNRTAPVLAGSRLRTLITPKMLGVEAVPERVTERVTESTFEPLYLVIVHNDDVTPFEYVLQILVRVFFLSEELAEHVAWTAHSEGQAVVIVRPRPEAERLIAVAHNRARLDNYPLAFSIEPER